MIDSDHVAEVSGPAQATLFDGGALDVAGPRPHLPEPTIIRHRLEALLATARAANTMPWPSRDARMWQTVFPQMANWLPSAEADRLRTEFASELARLQTTP